MSKGLYFLISFVLVLGLSGLAQAGTPIVVGNYSFEYDVNGNDNDCHTGLESVLAWEQTDAGSGFAGVDVNCGWEDVNCDNCHEWVEYPNGTTNLYYQGNITVYQILDHEIVYGYKYTMTVDLMAWDPMVIQFFALEDVCNPDVNHILISSSTVTPDVWYNTEADPARWMYEHDVELEGVITNAAMVGKKLGIEFGGTNEDYRWVDNVRVEYEWASNAYDPAPSDGAGDVNSQALTLSWLPGLWAPIDTAMLSPAATFPLLWARLTSGESMRSMMTTSGRSQNRGRAMSGALRLKEKQVLSTRLMEPGVYPLSV